MVEVETTHLIGITIAMLTYLIGRLERVCKTIEKLKMLARMTHPKESKNCGL